MIVEQETPKAWEHSTQDVTSGGWGCPLCKTESVRKFDIQGYSIHECPSCAHRFVAGDFASEHVEEVYSDEYFTGGAAGYDNYFSEKELLRDHGKRYGQLLKKYREIGTLLDVGSAAGFVLQGLQDEGWKGIGLEPNISMTNYAKQELELDVQTGTLEDLKSASLLQEDGSPIETFDVVTMIQVIGHFTDPLTALQNASRLTAENGYWLIECWNRKSWMARLLGKNWHEYSPPSVLHWYTPDSLERLAAKFQMKKIATGRPAKRLKGEHAKSLLRYKLISSRWMWIFCWPRLAHSRSDDHSLSFRRLILDALSERVVKATGIAIRTETEFLTRFAARIFSDGTIPANIRFAGTSQGKDLFSIRLTRSFPNDACCRQERIE